MDGMNGDDQNAAIGSEVAPTDANDDESLDSFEQQLLYDSDKRPIFNDQLLHRIQQNDPNITSIDVYFGDDTYEGKHVDWSQEPHASTLGNNAQIKELHIYGTGTEEGEMDSAGMTNFEHFCKSVAGNGSIEHFSADLSEIYFSDIDFDSLHRRSLSLPSLLVPFIKNNDNLIRLGLNLDLTDSMLVSVGSALKDRGSRGRSLEALDLCCCQINDTKAIALFRALSGHTNLKHLNMCSNSISFYGCVALQDLILGSNINLERLLLSANSLNDASIKVLNNILKNNSTLREIYVSNNPNVTPDGWKVLSGSLMSPNLVLESLNLYNNNLDADATIALAKALVGNETLLVFNLRNVSIGSTGLQAISPLLGQSSKPQLKKLLISGAGIGDQGVRALAHAMVGNRTLRKLAVCDNPEVTDKCWKELVSSMFGTDSKMRVFQCRGNSLSQETAVLVANMLVGNGKTPKRLYIGNLEYTASMAFSKAMCDTSSIMSCFLSNHTLSSLSLNWDTLAGNTGSLLQLNSFRNKTLTARLKIIYYYFQDGINVLELLELELNILPFAISWIGRDTDGFSLLNELVKGASVLFDSKKHVQASTTKRQRMH